MATRGLGKGLQLPDNPTLVDFPCSDGNPSSWPKNTTRVVDADSHVNFMDPLELDNPISVKWRVQIADAVALKLDWEKPNDKNYVLSNWPKGYAMYDHHKGPVAKPRHDIYLMGGPQRFRSVPEFVPHAAWLFNEMKGTCGCKYCSKQPQKAITSSMSGILRLSPGKTSPSIRTTHAKRSNTAKSRLREQKIYATVQKVSLQASKHLAGDYSMVVERNQDIRAINSRTDMKLRRWLREGELLWCALDRPIMGPNGNEDAITFWPALVDTTNIHSEALPGPDESVSWSVEQHVKYKVKLIATSDMITVPDHRVLPYQAYVPSDRLLETLAATPAAQLDFDKEHLSGFHPCPDSSERLPSFTEAISAYALALQIGSSLAQLWSLTDEWAYKYTLPTSGTSDQPAALQAALQTEGLQDLDTSGLAGPSVEVPKVDIMGVVPPSTTNTRSQTRFQGLWWGAERIWTDDFVRLKIPRRCIAPHGAQNILPPSGPGPATIATCIENGIDHAELGAGTRGVFLHLESLFTVDVLLGDGKMAKECRASGMLYELADADWEDPDAPAVTAGPSANSLPPMDPLSQSAQLSHPARSAHYLLPEAPPGFKFRPILPEGYESVLSLTLISGRYYPKILHHPLLSEVSIKATAANPEELHASDYLWALEGLAAGYRNAVDPERYISSRLTMLDEADKMSRLQLQEHKQNTLQEENEVHSYVDSMDFDD